MRSASCLRPLGSRARRVRKEVSASAIRQASWMSASVVGTLRRSTRVNSTIVGGPDRLTIARAPESVSGRANNRSAWRTGSSLPVSFIARSSIEASVRSGRAGPWRGHRLEPASPPSPFLQPSAGPGVEARSEEPPGRRLVPRLFPPGRSAHRTRRPRRHDETAASETVPTVSEPDRREASVSTPARTEKPAVKPSGPAPGTMNATALRQAICR